MVKRYRKTKLAIALMVVAALFIVMTGCGGTQNAAPETQKPAAEAAKPATEADKPATEAAKPAAEQKAKNNKIVMVAKMEGIAWFDDMRTGVEKFGKDYKVDATQIAPEGGDPAKQVQMCEDLIAQGVGAILVVPNDPKSMEPVLKKAKDKGIVVVSHEAELLAPIVDYDVEAFKNEDFGVLMFDTLAKAMNYEGKFTGFVGSLTMQTHMQWFNAGLDYVKQKYPKMEFVSKQPYEDNNEEKTAYAKVQEILKAYPDLKGLFGTSIASGCMESLALKEKNNRNIKVVALALPSSDGPYLKDGWLYQGQCWRPADAGYVSALVAYKVLNGEKIESGTDLKVKGYEKVEVKNKVIYGNAPLVLTKDNYTQFPF